MRVDVKMPDLAATEGSDILVKRWLAPVGSELKRGQPLLEVETDKATMEIESIAAGVLVDTRVRSGARVAVGEVIATIEVNR